MALVGTTLNNLSQVTVFKDLEPVIKATAFTGYTDALTDNMSGVPSDHVEKKFRWSNDKQTWSDWAELTNGNVAAITPDSSLPFYFEFHYRLTNKEADNSFVTIDSIEINATINFALDNTFKINYFKSGSPYGSVETTDDAWANLAGNLLQKIKGSGIVMRFIERTEDFIHYWKMIVDFLSLNYAVANRFSQIYNDAELLRDYLLQRNMFLSGGESLSELQAIADNFISEARDRGANYNEQIQRLVNHDATTDSNVFRVARVRNIECGWNLGQSSPMNGDMRHVRIMNRFPEAEWDEVTSISNYKALGLDTVESVTGSEGGAVKTIKIQVTSPVDVGIEDASLDQNSPLRMLIDTRFDYKLRVRFKADELEGLTFKLGLSAATLAGGAVTINNVIDNTPENLFITNGTVNTALEGEWVEVRGIIFNKTSKHPYEDLREYLNDYTQDDENGRHLRFDSATPDFIYVYPIITFQNTTLSHATIVVNVEAPKFTLADLEIGVGGLLDYHLILREWTNNGDLTDLKVERLVDKYLAEAKDSIIKTVQEAVPLHYFVLKEEAAIAWDANYQLLAPDTVNPTINPFGTQISASVTTPMGTLRKDSFKGNYGLDGGTPPLGGYVFSPNSVGTLSGGYVWAVFKYDSINTGMVWGAIEDLGDSSDSGLGIYINGNNLVFGADSGGGFPNLTYNLVTNPFNINNIADGDVMCVMGAYSDGVAELWLNGILVDTINADFSVDFTLTGRQWRMFGDAEGNNILNATIYAVGRVDGWSGSEIGRAKGNYQAVQKHLLNRYKINEQ